MLLLNFKNIFSKMRFTFLLTLDECKESMDLAILADISQSLSAEDLKQLRVIIHRVVDQLGVSETGNHFAVITFGGNATIINNFADKNYYSASHMKRNVTKALQNKSKHDGTRTDMAQHLAATKLFTAKGGDRPGVRNIMLIFTDGKFYINTTWDKRPNITLLKTTRELEVINFPFSFHDVISFIDFYHDFS